MNGLEVNLLNKSSLAVKTSEQPLILIVEDEVKLAEVLADYLCPEGYQVSILSKGSEVVPWVKKYQPDLILLDLMVPEVDGLNLCQSIRSFSETPIIMVTARVSEVDRLKGLELGADDYVCKTFSPREVVARVKAVLRRYQKSNKESEQSQILKFDMDSFKVIYFGVELELTVVEFKLLKVLTEHWGRVFSRSELMDRCYEDARIINDRTIDSHIKKIRKKLSQVNSDCELIQSIYGAGYKAVLPG